MGKLSQLALLCATLQLTFMLASSTTSSHTSLTSYYKVKYFCWHKQQVWCRHPAYVQYKNDICACVCKAGLTWDAKTKTCVCPYPGQYYNSYRKQCVCPSCQRWDSVTKTCVCRIPGQVYEKRWRKCVCPKPLVLTKDSKRCACPYPGQVFDSKQKTCVCPGDLTLSSRKRCECPPCGPNERLVQQGNQCQCVCNVKCTGLFVLDRKSCKCVCREGLVFNSKTNQCVCPYKGQVYTPKGCVCPGDLELDTKTGTCVCPTCPDNFRSEQNGNQCECVCDRKCTGLFILDSKACQCVCREGLVLNSKTNQCVCPYKGQVYTPKGCVCPGDLELDTKTGTCVCPTCPDNFRSEQTGNQCECVCDRKCTGLFILDSKACQCVCREGLVLNSKTNQCVCPYKGQVYTPKGCVCPGDLELDTKTGACVCPTCPDNFRLEQTGNQCECVCDRKCTGLFVLDSKACQCVCREGLVFNEKTNECECPEGQTPDPKTYLCVCPLKYQVYTAKDGCVCPEGLIPHPKTRSCVCPTCPRNFRWEQKGTQCNCICDIKCHGLAVLDRTTCQCQCPEGLVLDPSGRTCVCPNGLVLDQSTRTCLCPNRDQVYTPGKGCVCPGDLVFNSKTGSCECPTCPKGYTVTQSGDQCDCQCNIKCESPFVRSDTSCECVCPKGLVLDQSTRTCLCPNRDQVYTPGKGCVCPGDLVFNSKTGSCECPTCPKGYTVTQSGDQCDCQCNIKCESPFVRSDSSCECVCPKGTTLANGKCVCPEGQHYNSYYKQCRCSGDKVLNSDTGRCECSPCPHAGYTSIEKETTCKCVCTAICGEGRVLNQEECRCEEVATPPPMCRCKSKSPHPLHSIGCSRLSQKDCQAHASYQCTYVCQ